MTLTDTAAAPSAPQGEAPPAPQAPVVDGGTRASLLADLEKLSSDAPAEKPAETAPSEGAKEGDTLPDEKPPEVEAPAPEAAPEPAKAAEPEDPELNKRLSTIAAQEKRAKDSVAAERKEFERQRQEWERQRQEVETRANRVAELERRAKYDPASLLLELGATEDQLETHARQLYARSKAGQADPRLRETTAQQLQQLEQGDKLSQLQKQVEQLNKQLVQRDEESRIQTYIDTVAKRVSDDTPIVRNMLTKNPSGTRERLRQVAESIYRDTGEVPAEADVVATLEKFRRAELEEAGVDVTALAFKPAATKNPNPVAGEKRSANTLSNDLGTPTKPQTTPLDGRDLRDDVLKGLNQLER